MRPLLLLFSSFLFVLTGVAQSVVVDHSFGSTGVTQVVEPMGTWGSLIYDIDIDQDDNLLVVGTTSDSVTLHGYVEKFDPDGVAIPQFGINGRFTLHSPSADQIRATVIHSDGRIILTGDQWDGQHSSAKVVCVLPNGQLDSSFADNGVFTQVPGNGGTWTNDTDLLPDGRIVSMGSVEEHTYLICLNPNGSLDPTFGNGGIARFNVQGLPTFGWKMDVDSQGRIIVASRIGSFLKPTSIACTRILPDGILDYSFATDGHFLLDRLPDAQYTVQEHGEVANDVIVANDGSIYYLHTYRIKSPFFRVNAVLKLSDSGELDHTFGDMGVVEHTPDSLATGVPRSIVISPTNDITVVGQYTGDAPEQLFVMRFDQDGNPLDPTGTQLITDISLPPSTEIFNLSQGITTQSDGRILTAASFPLGRQGLVALRPLMNTSVNDDASLSSTTLSLYPNPTNSTFSIEGELDMLKYIELYDPLGKLIKSYVPQRTYTLPAGLNTGRYFVRMASEQGSEVLPLVVE